MFPRPSLFRSYYNHDTGETVWDKPEALWTDEEKQWAAAEAGEAEMPEWVKVYDPSTAGYYAREHTTFPFIEQSTVCRVPSRFAPRSLT